MLPPAVVTFTPIDPVVCGVALSFTVMVQPAFVAIAAEAVTVMYSVAVPIAGIGSTDGVVVVGVPAATPPAHAPLTTGALKLPRYALSLTMSVVANIDPVPIMLMGPASNGIGGVSFANPGPSQRICTPPGAGTEAPSDTLAVPLAPEKTIAQFALGATAPAAVTVKLPELDVFGETVTLVPHALFAAAVNPVELLLCVTVTETVCVSARNARAAGVDEAPAFAPKPLV